MTTIKLNYLEAVEIMDGGEALVAGKLAGGDAVDPYLKGPEDVTGDDDLVVFHVVAA